MYWSGFTPPTGTGIAGHQIGRQEQQIDNVQCANQQGRVVKLTRMLSAGLGSSSEVLGSRT